VHKLSITETGISRLITLWIWFTTDEYNENNIHLTAIFQDNPGKLLPEGLHSGFYWS